MKLRNLLIKIGRKFPNKSACFFDHVGYQCGNKDLNRDIKKIFLCLDYTEDTLKEIDSFKPDLIITHHPFFFGKREKILTNDPKKRELENIIIERNIAVYSFHTNYDKGQDGMNDILLEYLGFKKESILEDGMTRMFYLEKEMSTESLVDYLLPKFDFDYLTYLSFGKLNRKVCFLAGGGGNEFELALKNNADLYISGDISHHARVDISRYKLNYIELPHECEEIGFLKGMSRFLKQLDSTLEINEFYFETNKYNLKLQERK